MGLLDRIDAARRPARSAIDQYISEYLLPGGAFSFNGGQYPFGVNASALGLTQTLAGQRIASVAGTLPGYMGALRQSPPAFAAEMVRALVLSQARFTFRNRPWARTPRRLFGTTALNLLDTPWPNGTTGDLLALMEWHAGVAGMSYVARQTNRLRVLRPDWCGLVYGSDQEPEDAAAALDGDLLGVVYQNGGLGARNSPRVLLPDEVAIWAPLPDPENPGIGMSWITPAVREIQGDIAATQHKLQFFANGATPNMVVKGIPAATPEQFSEIVDKLEARHSGVANAYRTLYLTAGADATVVGSDLKQLDFKSVQGAGETRIATLSRVPAVILQIAEGLAGSSLNAGNFGSARRTFADTWVYPMLQDLSAALAPLVKVPSDAELWFDTTDIPLLREDAKDAAEIEQVNASTITALVREGFTPESAIAAVMGQNMTLLKHTGLVSVQLQVPGAQPAAPPSIPPKGGQ